MQPIEQFCCQNKECEDHGIRGKGNLSFRGWSGREKRIRVIFCCTCRERFSERTGTVLEQSRLSKEKSISILVTTSVGLFGHSAQRILKVIGTTEHRQWQQASLITYGLWKNGSAILSRLVSQIQTPPVSD